MAQPAREHHGEFLRARPVAILGASADPAKYGNIILRRLRGLGWRVFAVNPRGGVIDGQPAHPSVSECPETPALAVMVTPPPVTLGLLDELSDAGVPRVWFQEGSFDGAALARAAELGLAFVNDACIMVMATREDA
jgi:predicted CoA-binding protein